MATDGKTTTGTKFPEFFAALSAEFHPSDVKTLPKGGKQLRYITPRTAMNRLDDVAGPENWWDEYFPAERSVLCKLTVRLPDGSTITKMDAGGYAGMADAGDDEKSGVSDAFKRACFKFGIARYLYGDGMAHFGHDDHHEANGHAPAPRQEKQEFHQEKQEFRQEQRPAPARQAPPKGDRAERQMSQAPKTGRALFAWTKEQEARHSIDLLRYLNGWAKLQEFPNRMIDWDDDQVAKAHAEAVRKIRAVEPPRDEPPPDYDDGPRQYDPDDLADEVRSDIRRSFGPGADG